MKASTVHQKEGSISSQKDSDQL